MTERETLTRIAARNRARNAKETSRARWVSYAQLIAVVVACMGLSLSGFTGFLQYKTTEDQLRKSEEAKNREERRDASFFDVRWEDPREKVLVVYANYSHHTVRDVYGYITPTDEYGTQKSGSIYRFGIRYVPPCTEARLDYEKIIDRAGDALGKDSDAEFWDDVAVTYVDWEGQSWIQLTYAEGGFQKVDDRTSEEISAKVKEPLDSSAVEPFAREESMNRRCF